VPFHAVFPIVVTADWHTTDPHASERGLSRSSMSIGPHREYRKLPNPQSPFFLDTEIFPEDRILVKASRSFCTCTNVLPFQDLTVHTILRRYNRYHQIPPLPNYYGFSQNSQKGWLTITLARQGKLRDGAPPRSACRGPVSQLPLSYAWS
jgi:hypothetical protein